MSTVRGCAWQKALPLIVAPLGPLSASPQVSGSHGCGVAAPTTGTYTLDHRGVTRTYGLNMPSGYDQHRPARLVLVFHGRGGDEGEFLGDTTVVGESNRRGYIVVAPRGLGSGAPDRSNNSWTFRGSATGVLIFRAIAPIIGLPHRGWPASAGKARRNAHAADYRPFGQYGAARKLG